MRSSLCLCSCGIRRAMMERWNSTMAVKAPYPHVKEAAARPPAFAACPASESLRSPWITSFSDGRSRRCAASTPT